MHINITQFDSEKLKTLSLTPFTCNCIAAFEYMLMDKIVASIRGIDSYSTVKFADLVVNTDAANQQQEDIPDGIKVYAIYNIPSTELLLLSEKGTRDLVKSCVANITEQLNEVANEITIIEDACKFNSIHSVMYITYIHKQDK